MLKPGMDVVSDILGTLKLHGGLYFCIESRAPWSVRVPVECHVVRFHLVASGDCWITVGGRAEPIALTTGDFIVIPHGADQVLSDEQGRPPMQYLTEWRLQRARQMIAESGISIEQVARSVGYQSLPSFSRLFKRHFGVSPGRYRRSNTTETDAAT